MNLPSGGVHAHHALFVLLLIAGGWVAWAFSTHAFALPGWGMRIGAIALIALLLPTLIGLWRREVWSAWLSLAIASAILTIDLYAWATGVGEVWPATTAGLALVAIATAFVIGQPASATLTARQRTFYAIIIFFPAWVAAGGLFAPAHIDEFLPFKVPPLHARFIGAMYIAGAAMMLLAAMARHWSAVRVATAILGVWTGLLGLVSLIHLDVFDWSWRPTWFWWFAYLWFPIGAAFIVWNQRHETGHAAEPAMSPLLRMVLLVQGAVGMTLAVALLATPQFMAGLWPWAISPLLTQIYSAPFLAYGMGSIYAARQSGWSDVRIPIIAMMLFTCVAIVVSVIHIGLFNAANPSTWVWFGGLGLAALTLAGFAATARLRTVTP